MSAVFPTRILFLKNSDADDKIQTGDVEKKSGVEILQTAYEFKRNSGWKSSWLCLYVEESSNKDNE